MVMRWVSGLSLASYSDSESFLVVHALFSQDGCQREGFLEVVGHMVSPSDLSWTLPVWWLISSVFLSRTSCHKTTHANGYYGAWPGWAVSISVLPLTVLPAHRSILAFWGMCEFFSTVATSSSILPSKIQGSSVSTFSHHLLILCTLVIFCCFWSLHWSYLRCEIVSHCGFNLHFSSDKPC